MAARSPIAAGVALAVIAAVSFGATTPVVAWAGRGLGPFTTAALMYGGAAVIALALRRRPRARGAHLRRTDAPRLVAIAIVGAAVAPVLLAWGVQRAGATVTALLLNLEAAFTVALARMWYREVIGHRVALALVAMAAGGAAVVVPGAAWTAGAALGMAAVAGATLAWATDNALTRPLAEREPLDVVAAKASLGALCTTTVALIAAEPRPGVAAAIALVACGATGYGLSLVCYLRAQRAIGAARTASVFALAPFLGAALAIATGDRTGDAWTAVAAALMALGVWLHATERHAHAHDHPATEHDHLHHHDDGHHDHVHAEPVVGEHAHPHTHAAVSHSHDHAPDLHHDHPH